MRFVGSSRQHKGVEVLRAAVARLAASGASTSVVPSTVRTMAPASIADMVRLRSRTLSITVVHCLLIAAASATLLAGAVAAIFLFAPAPTGKISWAVLP